MLFLSESFTRPARLYGLAKLGFTQSYSYFTWRTSKWELTNSPTRSPGTPTAHAPTSSSTLPTSCTKPCSRAARVCSPSGRCWRRRWVRPGGVFGLRTVRERTRASGQRGVSEFRKYELRPRDFAGALAEGRSLEPFIARLNEIRHRHPALCQLRTIWFHNVDNDALIAYSKFDPVTGDLVLVVVSLNPFGPEEGFVFLDMGSTGDASLRPLRCPR